MNEIRQLLADYFAKKVTSEIDVLFVEKGWGEGKIEEWAKEHMRSKYNVK